MTPMARFLVTLSLGPVQSLIGAARRTRDLWCGSWLLSEAARAAARRLHERHPGCLVFPCPDAPASDLGPQDEPGDAANIANILRAEVDLPDAEAARALCDEAKAAAVARLTEIGESAKGELDRMGRPLQGDVWRVQIGDLLECFAAWAPIRSDPDGGYAQVSRRLGGALAARKATRDFPACKPLPTSGLPKSSLDGALETVLPKGWSPGDRARRRLGLSDGEQLDALGVIKRLAGDSEQFTAWPRIAADPWIRRLTDDQQRRLCDAYEALVGLDLAMRVRGNAGIYQALPFDALMLYPFRLDNALSGEPVGTEHHEALTELKGCTGQLRREKAIDGLPVGEPVPYAAILKADGDRMGALLARAESAQRSRQVSRALHRFASSVRGIIRRHRGHAIYAGGDDVLALVPLVRAVGCSCALADAFADSLAGVAADMDIPPSERPTLSVGLGIGHMMEPMAALRARADRAEHAAKGDATKTSRNALAIALGIRSGAEVPWRAQWIDDPAFDALARMNGAFRDGLLPSRAAYDLRAIDRRLAWLREDDGETARGMRAAELERLLDQARGEGGGKRIPADLRGLILERAAAQPLNELADTLIIARWLAARTAGDLGERP